MKPKLSNMDKEELRKRMSKAIGTFENQMVRRISEDCAEIAMQYFTEQLNKHSVSGKRPTDDEINAQAKLTCDQYDTHTGRIIHQAAYETGARWARNFIKAACASGAVDKTVSEDEIYCDCGRKRTLIYYCNVCDSDE